MNSSDEPLQISTDALDTLFVQALQVYVTRAVPSPHAWKHIEEDVRRFMQQQIAYPRGGFDMNHLPHSYNALLTEIQHRL